MRSLLVEQRLDIWHHVVWFDAMGEELDYLALTIEQVLGEVPLDLAIRRLRLQVLEEGRGCVTFDVDFAHAFEANLVVGLDPLLDLSLRPRLLRTKLVARECQNSQTIARVCIVHLLVLAIVPIGQASLRRDVDYDNGLRTLDEGADRHFRFISNPADEALKEFSSHLISFFTYQI